MSKHYEKVITLCCFLFLFANIGLPSTSFNVYQPYLVALPAVGDTGASMVLAFRTLVSLVSMLFVDRYYVALGTRRGVFFACMMTAAGFVVYGFASTLPLLFLGALFAGAGYGFGGMIAMTMLTNRWYASGKGTAIGFASVGTGVAAIIIPIIVVRIIDALALGYAFWFEAVLAAVIGIVSLLFIRNSPEEIGAVRADGSQSVAGKATGKVGKGASSSRGAGKKASPAAENIELSKGARILLIAALVCVGGIVIGSCTYLSVLYTSAGYDEFFAAAMLSLLGGFLTVSKFVTGELFDHIGSVKASALVFGIAVVGLALSCVAGAVQNTALAMVAAALIGAGMSVGTTGISVWSLELSNSSNYARFVKNCQVAYAFGGFLINLIPGPLKELTGTYVTSYVIMTAMCAFGAVAILAIYRRYRS